MRISDWSSDVCSSDLRHDVEGQGFVRIVHHVQQQQFEGPLYADLARVEPLAQAQYRGFPFTRIAFHDRLDYVFLALEQAIDLAARHMGRDRKSTRLNSSN